jgi:hypothetical protein
MLVSCTITPSVLKQAHIVQEPHLFRSSCDQIGRHVHSSVRQIELLSVTGPMDTLSPQDGNRISFRNIVFFFEHDTIYKFPNLHVLKFTLTRFTTNPNSAVDTTAKTRPIPATPLTLSNSSSKLAWRHSSKRVFITTCLFALDLFCTWNYCITFTLLCSKLQFEILLLVGW